MSTTVYLYDNVLLDKEYRNISNIRVSTSTRTPVKSYTGLSFQRVESEIINSGSPRLAGTIRLPLNNDLEVLRKCGYMTFQNSGDIKYYAFIDEVNYINAGNVEIKYTIDDFQTYLTDYLNNWTDECFVEQEHINRSEDIASELDGTTQTIKPCDLVWNENNYYKYRIPDLDYISLCILYDAELVTKFEEAGFVTGVMNIGKSPLTYVYYNGKMNMEVIKKITEILSEAERYKFVSDCVVSCYKPSAGVISDDMATTVNLYPKNIGSYYFKNAILATFPYNQIILKSSTGESINIKQKECKKTTADRLIITLNHGPFLNKNATVFSEPLKISQSSGYPSSNKTITFPVAATVPVQKDQLLTFLSTNAATTAASIATSLGTAVGGLLLFGSGVGAGIAIPMIVGGTAGFAGSMLSMGNKLENMVEPTGRFSSDIYSLYGHVHGFEVITYTPSLQETKMIDDYFSMYGYVTNKVKIPNIKNRNNFNFVKCHDISNFRGVPPRAKTAMTNAFSKGVFIWHNLGQIGNYDIDTNG